ncbi:hypothetical protein [Micromonospora sp. NBC_01813]|uniref:hypothetical protein n=1 Tax=Micromonospora sp. NBC_01813 TaxID=2975988 RepID=UPI002DDA1D01|nr:hypothetical protein [Micromonospora sp. NBC_01813]WSA07475.1 hypothetical protein OG958_24970 [Micromonospora sp. NBC_01813]
MAVRGWGRSVATATGIAAGVGAAQLGLGYGLGIVAWLPSVDSGGEAAWVASLAWATWIAATSVVLGAVVADRLAPTSSEAVTTSDSSWQPENLITASLWRIALAAAAAIGGMLTVALIAVPARGAARADTFSPQTIAAGYAMVGAVVGLFMAIWAVASRAAANNAIATVGWLWLLAVIAVIDSVISGPGLTSAQLGVWQITADSERYWFRNIYWPGATLSLGSAFIIGAFSAWPAARDARRRVGAAISGGVGPVLIAAAYFLAAPRLVGPRAEQLSAHLLAPYAVIAGLAGSVLVTAIAQRLEVSRRHRDQISSDDTGADAGDASPAAEPAGGTAGNGNGSDVAVPSQPTAGSGADAPARGTAAVAGTRGTAAVARSGRAKAKPPKSGGTAGA